MKIAVDTNIILRIITADDERYLAKARALVKRYGADDIFVSYAVMVEVHYVLVKLYHYSKEEMIEAFEDLMRVEQFYFEHEPAIRLALAKYRNGLSFADSLIGEIGALKNLKTHTFDKDLRKDPAFVVLI